MPSEELFNTVQFFPDGTHEYIIRAVPCAAAMERACAYIARPAATIGLIQRIIVTDAGDCTCFEWRFEKGITFPDGEVIAKWNALFAPKVTP